MSCYFPLHAFRTKHKDSSKIGISFHRKDSDFVFSGIDIPCGQCIGCRLEKSRQWAVRCMHEASLYDKNCFLTLTYSDQFLPKDGSLHLEHFQLFMKRLRKEFGSGIRFYHCGEYGEATFTSRPHYHALLFNHDFDDKKFFSERGGHRLFTSDSLSRLWPQGYSVIGEVTFESAAYVARYVMKKVTGKKSDLYYGGVKPEYSTMSRRPGIGKGWFDKFKDDVYPLDRVVVRGKDTRPPRYYDSLFQKLDPSTMALIKIKREDNERFVVDVVNGRSVVDSDSSDRRLYTKSLVKSAEISNLRRSL